MSEQFLQEPELPRRRRKSSVGHIKLGDTSVYALQTMQSQREANSTKRSQRKQINEAASESNDLDILKKIWVSIKILSYRHTWLPPFIALVIPQITYFLSNNYTESNPLHQFLELSYEIPGTEPKMYGKGKKDICFVLYMVVFFTFYREFLMQVILKPIAKHFGLRKDYKLHRFMEQSYAMCYAGMTGPWGLYIMKHTTLCCLLVPAVPCVDSATGKTKKRFL
ncbi:unnamed protein product [Ambrosiozyma monospora]|uniref:Unnamed protein product n=1 Tax=Ambrosiozyma monospora TaxID=43982 RepID=A0ACB5TVY2_AMBMO|nr:unnamed protein product [Ambrosiozyma monospora]